MMKKYSWHQFLRVALLKFLYLFLYILFKHFSMLWQVKTKLNPWYYNPLQIMDFSAQPFFLDHWPRGAIPHISRSSDSLTRDAQCLVPSPAQYSFYQHRRDKSLNKPCPVCSPESNCGPPVLQPDGSSQRTDKHSCKNTILLRQKFTEL